MRFRRRTEEELAHANLLEPGEYPFEIVRAEERTSKAGNAMFALTLRVVDAEGRARLIDDWLVDDNKMHFKIKHCAYAVGLADAYNAEEIQEGQWLGRAGICKVRVEKRPDTFDRNTIADYVVPPELKDEDPARAGPHRTSATETRPPASPQWGAAKAPPPIFETDEVPF